MTDPRVDKLAHLLVNYCIQVEPGDRIFLSGPSAALPLLSETYRYILRAGGHPTVNWREEIFTEILLKEGSDEQICHIPEPMTQVYKTYDGIISIRAALNTRSLSGADPKKQQLRNAASQELMQLMMQRTKAGELNWVGTLFPTHAQAQEADMSLGEFEDFVYRACYLDHDDPVAAWHTLSTKQQKLVDWLSGKKHVKVNGPNANLELSIEGRTFTNADGQRNMPSGEIFTGPVETSVNGWIRYTYPAIYNGREVEGIELTFEDGKVVDAEARKNKAFLLDMLDTDEGSRYVGEFAIGTNNGIDRFTKSILFDEKIGGTLHMALGMGYPETGSKNESALHWDMICDMRNGGQIWVDDELFYDSGRFVLLNES